MCRSAGGMQMATCSWQPRFVVPIVMVPPWLGAVVSNMIVATIVAMPGRGFSSLREPACANMVAHRSNSIATALVPTLVWWYAAPMLRWLTQVLSVSA